MVGGREEFSPGDRDLVHRLVACVGRCLFLSPILFMFRVGGLAIQCPLENVSICSNLAVWVVLLSNFNSPRTTTKPAVEDFFRPSNWREDQAIVKNEVEDSLLEFKAFHLILKGISVQPRTAVYGFTAVTTSSTGPK